jgi:PHS family inorganic phosphate transporter-like MFS transporter
MPPANHYVEGQYLQKVPSGAVSEVGSTSQMRSPTPFHTDAPGNINMEPETEGLEEEQQELPPAPSWKDFKKYFWHDGNLRTLIATSFCWFCLDLPFYGLGMNSPRITRAIWTGKDIETQEDPHFYPLLVDTVWQTLVVVSLGAITGCLITFVAIDKLGRRNIQMIGFFWLFILFVVIGGSFNHLYEHGGSSATIVLYILCQIFFNFGKLNPYPPNSKIQQD